MNEPMECPRCKEITLKHINTDTGASGKVYEEWECSCGEYHIFDVVEKKHPGFDEFYHSIGPDVLDSMSMLERMQIAWMAGRTYERKDTIKKLKPLQNSIAGLEKSVKRQA